MDQLEEIKSKIDIVALISEHIQLARAGRNFKANCPFHQEKTASFIVSPELQIWRCFGACNEGGDVFKFLMKMEGLEFPEAVRTLAERAGVKITARGVPQSEREKIYNLNSAASQFYHYLLTRHPIGNTALSYLKHERGLQDSTIKEFGIGFSPNTPGAIEKFLINKKGFKKEELVRAGLVVNNGGKLTDRFRGRVVFPLVDQRGNILGFSGRLLPRDEGKTNAKYVNTQETLVYHKRAHLFGLGTTKNDIKKEGHVVVVEGEFDLISLWQAGIHNVVAIKGSSLTVEQVKLISRFIDDVILVLDSDPAGEHAARAGVMIAEGEGLRVKIADLGTFKDPDEAVRVDKEGLRKKIRGSIPAYDYFLNRALIKWDHRTSEGIRLISQDLAPLLAQIPDRIVRAHYSKILAEKLGVDGDAVISEISRVQRPEERKAKEESGEVTKKTRRELLEERLISLGLTVRPEFIIEPQVRVLITLPILLRIEKELESYLSSHKKFSDAEFLRTIPPELVDAVSNLLLLPDYELQLVETGMVLRELNRTAEELQLLDTQEKISRLTRDIRRKEEMGDPIKKDQENLVELTRDLARLTKISQPVH